jgi:hypothetical protein
METVKSSSFKIIGPLAASRLKGCSIHWSRGNAVLQCQQVSFSVLLEDMHCQEHVTKRTSKFLGWPGAHWHPAKFPEQKCSRFFSRNHGEKIWRKWRKKLDMTHSSRTSNQRGIKQLSNSCKTVVSHTLAFLKSQ